MKATTIITMCAEAGEPALAADFIAQAITPKKLRARLDQCADIRAIVARAKQVQPDLPDIGDELIATGANLDEIRDVIGERLFQMQSPEICSARGIEAPAPHHGWGAVIAKAGKK